jgi:uncharacterized UBP type Zn finger protein
MLQILLNAPVFLRRISQLYASLSLQMDENHTDIQAEKEFLFTLWNIVKTTLEEYHSDDINVSLPQSLCDKYKVLYPGMRDGIQQDAAEFLIHLMNVMKSVACKLNQTSFHSKAFEIISSVKVDDNEYQSEQHHAVRVLPNERDFSRHINEHCMGTVVEDVDGRKIMRTYKQLPEQLVATTDRQQDGSAVHHPYPTEFTTCLNQNYLFTGAVIHDGISLDFGHYTAVVRRQDSVYIIDGLRIIDRFHINHLPAYFETVLSNKIDSVKYLYKHYYYI